MGTKREAGSVLPEGTVTFLFTDIEGSTELLKALGNRYAELLEEQRRIVRACSIKWDGTEVDTQGDSFFLSFPRATQAISVAIEIQRETQKQQWPEGVEVRLRIGLHTGEPLTWAEGYMGIDVHRAARIAAVGHGGQVLLSATTTPLVIDELPDGVSLINLGRHRLKDIHRAERIHQLVIEGLLSEFPPLTSLEALPTEVTVDVGQVQLPAFLKEAETPPPVFVGRERVMGRLDASLNQVMDGKGQIVFVTGGPGRGKTAILDAFARETMGEHDNLLVVNGECSAYTGIGDPYAPFRGALEMLTGNIEARWASGRISRDCAVRLWKAMPEIVQDLIETGPDLIDVFVSGRQLQNRTRQAVEGATPWLERLATLCESELDSAGDLGQRNLFEQYTELLVEVAERHGLILMLDDMQWADAASIQLLFHMGRQLSGKRLLILGAYRPEEIAIGREGITHPLEKVLSEFKRMYGKILIDLSEEGEQEGQKFINAYLGTEENKLSEDFHKALFEHTGGHPLFTVELLRDLQERGDLVQDSDGFWIEGNELDWGALPVKVEGVIEERIGRLKGDLRETLTIASVEGEAFTSQVVSGVQQVEERKLLKRLSRELEKQHRLVKAKGESRVGDNILSQYQFSHVLIQRFLYNELGSGERRLLHQEIGGILEDLYGEEKDAISVQLAYHFAAAKDADRAIHYLLIAGDRARLAYANQEAIDFYNQALTLQKDQGNDGEAARTLMKLGLTYHAAFEFDQAHQAYEQGFILWRRAGMAKLPIPPAQAPHALRLNWPTIITLDPNLTGDSFSSGVITNTFSGLVNLDFEMNIEPDIARSWNVSSGGRKYIFHLRDDIRWSDDAPVTAGDFVFAWKRALNPVTKSQMAHILYDIKGSRAFHQGETSNPDAVGVHALDDLTLAVELEEPTGHFLHLMANCSTFPLPQHIVKQYGKEWTTPGKIVTNGPFRLESWQKGKTMVLERNPNYHERFGGNLQRIKLNIVTNPAEHIKELDMYMEDNLDVFGVFAVLPEVVEKARRLYAGEFISRPGMATYYLAFHVLKTPFDDIRVRKAFVLATDRVTLVNLKLGYASVASGGYIPPGIPGHSAGIALPYDPEGARALLAEAGYPDGLDFPTVHCLAPDVVDSIKDYLLSQWRENLGVEIMWETTEWTEYLERINSTEIPEMWWGGWEADYPDPDSYMRLGLYLTPENWRTESFINLIEKARRIQDQNKRMQVYRQADATLINEARIMPLSYGRIIEIVKPWVSRYPMSGFYCIHWKDVILEPH